MEKVLLIGGAVLLVAYFIFTETLDWVGRMEVIRDHFPKFPEFLERRIFRVALLLVAIALLIRVATERDGKKAETDAAPSHASSKAERLPEAKKNEPPPNQPNIGPQVTPIPNGITPKQHSVSKPNAMPKGGTSTQPQQPPMTQDCGGGNCAQTSGQQGGITAGIVIGTPPCPWKKITNASAVKMASPLSSSRATISITFQSGNEDATHLGKQLEASLRQIAHWNIGNLEAAISSDWDQAPGVTLVVRDAKVFDDETSDAAKLKRALHSLGIDVHTKESAPLANALHLLVGPCE
jgi:hypothetical protein